VVTLKTELEALREHLFSDNSALTTAFRDDLTLGGLQTSYANFLTRYKEYRQVIRQSYVQKKIAALDQQIQHYHALAERSARQKNLLQQELELSQRQYERYRHLKVQALVSQKDLEVLHSTVLQNTYALEEAEAELEHIHIQIAQIEASKLDLTHQSDEQHKELRLAFDEAYKTLIGQITAWEHANLLTAPIDGTVTFTDYWSANQNVKTGDVVMTVVPDGSSHLLGKVQLPVQGAGKVKPDNA
jgi:multidrug resistance efflux pump